MGAKKVSQKGKGSCATYKATGKYEKNRKRRLERHLKKYPDDAVAQAALKNITYRRYTPHVVGGWINRKDPSFHGVPANSAQVLAQVKKIVSKVSNELATNRGYRELLKAVAVEAKNKEIKAAEKNDKRSGKPNGQKPNKAKKSGK